MCDYLTIAPIQHGRGVGLRRQISGRQAIARVVSGLLDTTKMKRVRWISAHSPQRVCE